MALRDEIANKVDEVVKEKLLFTGQISLDFHLKEGKIVDCYLKTRSKISNKKN